ncbi:hypothetical protein Cni_G21271 [Canna indica]|uniref:BHLH domain-containing protein n=1 Tax=Canna indica TaxID=4628 RepID=A0AAQ3KPM5_9LILI|nr:hypothetical protein Cni_G21271 [Canna indica]
MKVCQGGGTDSKLQDKKTVEKYRRMHMKSLCFKLSSVIPKEHRTIHKDVLTQQDNLDQATSYIKVLQERVENLKRRRLMVMEAGRAKNDMGIGFRLPIIEVRHRDLTMEVLLISGLSKKFMFHEVISVLEEEGAEIVNASFSVVGDKIFHTIHSQLFNCRMHAGCELQNRVGGFKGLREVEGVD